MTDSTMLFEDRAKEVLLVKNVPKSMWDNAVKLLGWIDDFRFTDLDLDKCFSLNSQGDGILIYLYTKSNSYQIVLTEGGYLGAQGGGRTPAPGSKVTGGRDLHDGDFSKSDWHEILTDIVSYELVDVLGE